jgi:hypothetical protein
MPIGRRKKYKSETALCGEIEGYFKSISRTVDAKERSDTGEKDSDGRKIYEESIIYNDKGEKIRYTEFVIPPTLGGLCEYLGIQRSVWSEYCDMDKHPEFHNATAYALGRIRGWNESELLTRKDVKGIIFNLQNNYGYSDRRELDIGSKASKACDIQGMSISEKAVLLRQLRDEAITDDGGNDVDI